MSRCQVLRQTKILIFIRNHRIAKTKFIVKGYYQPRQTRQLCLLPRQLCLPRQLFLPRIEQVRAFNRPYFPSIEILHASCVHQI